LKLVIARWPITCISGIALIIINNIFLIISFVLFPTSFNIFENTASTLGNATLNPNGAIFSKLGNIILGILFFPYFIGLKYWDSEDKISKRYLNITIILGYFMGIALIMIGIFSQEYRPFHLISAAIYFILSFLALIFMGLFLRRKPESIKSIVMCNFITALLHITLIFVLTAKLVIFEWVIIFAANINIILQVYNYKYMYNNENKV
jgi:hypothetical membrane protein